MADFLDEKKREIDARLKELRPLVEEYQRLEAAVAALGGVPASAGRAAGPPPKRRQQRRAAAAAPAAGKRRRGRPRGSGTRSKQALELVRTRPGITIPEI